MQIRAKEDRDMQIAYQSALPARAATRIISPSTGVVAPIEEQPATSNGEESVSRRLLVTDTVPR